jgi:WD40 repeat protein
VASKAPIRTFLGHVAGVNSVAFSADGAWFVTGSSDNSMILWDRATGEQVKVFEGHSGPVSSVAINADSTRLLSGSADTTVRLWDIAAGRELRRFTGHDRKVTGVAFTPNGEDIISTSSDGTVRVWSVEDGIEMRRLVIQSDRGRTIGFKTLSITADGSRALGGLVDNSVRLLRLLPEKTDLLEWARANRFVRGLTCTERLLLGVEDPTNTVFVGGDEYLPLIDASGAALDSLESGTPLRVLHDETPEDALLPVCTPDGMEGFVDASGITTTP